jgi:peroxiredoxin Q/BCP
MFPFDMRYYSGFHQQSFARDGFKVYHQSLGTKYRQRCYPKYDINIFTSTMLKVGDKAPDFSGVDENGNKISLKDFKGKKVVLYFYPKDNTTGCTAEACDFRDSYSRIKRKGVVLLGVSPDSEKSHQNFKEKYDLPFPLIADTDKTIANAYDVWQEKSMYGRKYMGIVRSTFVIDEKGKIMAVFPKVKVTGHVDQVLEALG